MKKPRTLIGVFAIAVAACGGSTVTSEPAPPDEPTAKPTPSDSESSLKTALATYDAVGAHDTSALEAHLAEDFVQTGVDHIGPAFEGTRAKYIEFWRDTSAILPSFRNTQLVTVANGLKSASLYHFDSGAADKRFVVMLGEANDHDAQGRIRAIREYGDTLAIYSQTGVRPDEGAAEAEPVWQERFAVAATGSPEEAANLEVVRKFFASDAAGAESDVSSLLADDVHLRVVTRKAMANGKEALAKMAENRHSLIDVTYEMSALWGAGEWVVGEYSIASRFKTGRHSGKELSHHVLSFIRVQSGKISHIYFVYNTAHNAIALGDMTEAEFLEAKKRFGELMMPKKAP